jgi:hypothetical protein
MGKMRKRPYWIFSIAIFMVWGIVFLVHWLVGSPPHPKTLLPIFLGYLIGWLTATIAHYMYR